MEDVIVDFTFCWDENFTNLFYTRFINVFINEALMPTKNWLKQKQTKNQKRYHQLINIKKSICMLS